MSEHGNYLADLEASRKREAYLERVRATTTSFYNQYLQLLQALVQEGLKEFLPVEWLAIKTQLSHIERNLSEDPEQARDISMVVGSTLSRLQELTRRARRQVEQREQERRAEQEKLRLRANSDLQKWILAKIMTYTDPVVLDFAYEEIRSVQQAYQESTIDPERLQGVKKVIERQFSEIIERAKIQANDWKQEQTKQTSVQANKTLVSMYTTQIQQEVAKSSQARDISLANNQDLEQLLSNTDEQETITTRLQEMTSKIDRSLSDESNRRIIVQSIVGALKSVGFVVSAPQLETQSDEVLIQARKPAGAEASFRVALEGAMLYQFEKYEGMKCKDDIDSFFPLLTEIYGVTLSDKRVLWQNPERISKSAKPLDTRMKERTHG